jgi:hypothetical protein
VFVHSRNRGCSESINVCRTREPGRQDVTHELATGYAAPSCPADEELHVTYSANGEPVFQRCGTCAMTDATVAHAAVQLLWPLSETAFLALRRTS